MRPSLPLYQSQNQNIVGLIINLSVENMEKLKYLAVTVTNTNNIREEIKHKINMRNSNCYSLEKILSHLLLCKKLKVHTYKITILPVVLYGSQTWSHLERGAEVKVVRE